VDPGDLLRHLPLGVVAIDADGRIASANPRAIALLGLKDAAGKSPKECFAPDLAESVERQVATKGTGIVRSVVVGELSMVIASEPAGGAIVAVMPSGIASHLGHELKTPLTSIKAYTEAIDMMAEEEQMKSFLKVILDETDRLIAMIDREVGRWRSG